MGSEEIARIVGEHEACIEDIKTDIKALKARPTLPAWICRSASFLTPILILTLVGMGFVANYRLQQIESNFRQHVESSSAHDDRLMMVIAQELARSNVTMPAPTSAVPSRGGLRHGALVQTSPPAVSNDSTQVARIFRRLKSGMERQGS